MAVIAIDGKIGAEKFTQKFAQIVVPRIRCQCSPRRHEGCIAESSSGMEGFVSTMSPLLVFGE
jgi:hypothetical protein